MLFVANWPEIRDCRGFGPSRDEAGDPQDRARSVEESH